MQENLGLIFRSLLQGSKSPKAGKEGSGSKNSRFPAPQVRAIRIKNPLSLSLWFSVEKWGFLDSKHRWDFLTLKPSFPDFGDPCKGRTLLQLKKVVANCSGEKFRAARLQNETAPENFNLTRKTV